jgi:hypothetical protein
MTRSGVGGRVGGRPVVSATALITLIVVAALVAGCGDRRPSTASPSPSTESPGFSGPAPTAWPGNAVLGIEALGAADGPILAAINDLGRGVQTEDLALIGRAADGLAGLGVLLPNMEKINVYEPMRSFSDRYGAAVRGIVSAATAVRSAIDAGDSDAITGSAAALITSLNNYTAVQPELAAWVEQSIAQRRLLVR